MVENRRQGWRTSRVFSGLVLAAVSGCASRPAIPPKLPEPPAHWTHEPVTQANPQPAGQQPQPTVSLVSHQDASPSDRILSDEQAVVTHVVDEVPLDALAVQPVATLPVVTLVSEEAEQLGIAPDSPSLPLNLPTALSMVGGQHPVVGQARWRVREAYAELAQAKILWLPSIRAGLSLNRHDGNLQASDGNILDVNRNALQYGLGVGATGAGTTQLPGLLAQFHLADAIYQPAIAEKTAWAHGHAAQAALNDQLLLVSQAYFRLLQAHQDWRILEDSEGRARELAKLTRDFAETGQGLNADADRVETEVALIENRILIAQEQVAGASAELAQALSLRDACPIEPLDVTVLPIDMLSVASTDKCALIQTALVNRPELKESQALVAAACAAYKREKHAPFVPSLLLGFSTGGFGGGLGNDLNNVNDRYDFDAAVSWQLRNMGLGDRAAADRASARMQQARFAKVQVMDQVAREVSEAHAQVLLRKRRIEVAQKAIAQAEETYRLNLERIRDGAGLPLEVLQSVQALETARRTYLEAVTAHNLAQFQLQWALGWQS